MKRSKKRLAALLAVATLGGCDGKPARTSPAPMPTGSAARPALDVPRLARGSEPAAPATGKRCILWLHGKSGRGAPTTVEGEVTHLRPDGNAPGWGGLEWRYFPEARYAEVAQIVRKAAETAGCGRVILHGFSNGAAAAAKLYCRGETLGGSLLGVIVDDPVTDHAVNGCTPPPFVALRLYWTGGLANAHPGWDCTQGDWTCEGGSTIGIEAYARLLGTVAAPSAETSHRQYSSPPEHRRFW